MKGFNLSAEEIQELRAAHKAAKRQKKVKDAYKINAVILLGTGWSIEEVSEILLLDDETIRNYAVKFREGSIERLLETSHKGSNPKLSKKQLEDLCEELDRNIYLTTKAICDYVKNEFGVKYKVSGMTDLLHRLNYTYKKPKCVPSNPDIDAQEIFIKQFNDFMANKPEDEAVFFVDAVHPVHNSMAGYGWIKKGKEKELKTNSGRKRLNIHGAMNAETLETTIISGEASVNTDSTIELLTYLEEIYPLATVIYIILDNASYHFSAPVQEYLKKSRVRLVFLPTYSPELNLIERLWRVFKKNVIYNKFYETFQDFKKACTGFFENQTEYYDQIESIMGDGLEALT